MADIDLLEITKPNDDKAKTQKAPSTDSAFWVLEKAVLLSFYLWFKLVQTITKRQFGFINYGLTNYLVKIKRLLRVRRRRYSSP